MKILFIGASGSIGGEALRQCLAHPQVTSIVCFVRRPLPSDVSDNPKLQSVMIKDFSVWPEEVLLPHVDAAAMIWYVSSVAMGSYRGNVRVDMEYPLAFQSAFAPLLEKQPKRPRFRFIHLSGKFVIQDQDAKLWVNDYPRKLKGLCEVRSRELAEEHASVWRALVLRPGGVVTQKMMIPGLIARAILGNDWVVLNPELGAYFTYLAISEESEPEGTFLIENRRIVEGGRKFLKRQASS
ncbi:hypothetical protein FPSE_05513 [Fusarium pseudograminearum CS3096]|uniref:NAD(P)-binding domain-containing protein n=1 Tax=Fusarium pseudograminearum (strain CS3096) TaxID=1028729 RepID=K3UPH6_FUSPC|nr:hypothetical protein FPSE_05513 [Fusarium pseudograminearum CS3096]EKJ74216.1 hypothetical protein FPSE_05513 [Fusarium pseudograminearum CS3096]